MSRLIRSYTARLRWSYTRNESGGCKFRNCIMQNKRGVRANNAQQAFFPQVPLGQRERERERARARGGITSFVDINYKRNVHVPLKRDN